MEELEKSRKGGAVTAHTYAYVAAAAAYNGDDALVHHLVAERMKVCRQAWNVRTRACACR